MERLITKVGEAVVILLSVLLLGAFVPFTIALFVYASTEATFAECTSHSIVFWLFTIIGWIGAYSYINEDVMGERY